MHSLVFLAVIISATCLVNHDEENVGVSTSPILLNYIFNLVMRADNLAQRVKKLEKIITDSETKIERVEPFKMLAQGPQQSCHHALQQGYFDSTFYYIKPTLAKRPFLVLCDMETLRGGWTYVLNRYNGSQKFDLPWHYYKHGFGNINGDFWLGLDSLHYLTGDQNNELFVELEDWNSDKAYALYDSFEVGDEDEGYMLKKLGGYQGSAGDSFSDSLGSKFSTLDHNRDPQTFECVFKKNAGWWFRNCSESLLTGEYYEESEMFEKRDGIYWTTFRGKNYYLKHAKMMIRPAPLTRMLQSPESTV
ncbi:angiopoietin-related protein 2-like isoform X1 [Zophobas morio]|uniref:angiopoietin-related protein 2-like isoform X1 n=2 Tax=Zophobas morio TaxID=2755281 RepID=UPI00308351D5